MSSFQRRPSFHQLIGRTMQTRVLSASSSLSRRLWYRTELERRGFEVQTASDGLTCIESAGQFRPHILILEPFLAWGGIEGVMDIRQSDADLKGVPVIVIDTRRDAAQTYRIGAYELAWYWRWSPTADELIDAIRRTLSRIDMTHSPRVASGERLRA